MAATTAEEQADWTPLGHREERFSPADSTTQVPKRQRGGTYEVFIPDRIGNRDFSFDGRAVAALVEAEAALAHLDATPPRVATLGALARNLLRSESAASSRIEGVLISQRRLARAAYRQEVWLERLGRPRRDSAARQLVSALPLSRSSTSRLRNG